MTKHSAVTEAGLFSERLPIEKELIVSGHSVICGVDEAGRGPLAGPVVAAAVIFRDCELLWQARDSKTMTFDSREEYFGRANGEFEYALALCSPEEIDEINILQASLLAMERAVAQLSSVPSITLVDGNHRLKSAIPSRAIVHGDARVALIGAASIIAKVTRDRMMCEYDRQYPGYGFARHFGYPTEFHRRNLRQLGPCPIHRRSYRGVREFFEENQTGQATRKSNR
jgi:ribonuclease HII